MQLWKTFSHNVLGLFHTTREKKLSCHTTMNTFFLNAIYRVKSSPSIEKAREGMEYVSE